MKFAPSLPNPARGGEGRTGGTIGAACCSVPPMRPHISGTPLALRRGRGGERHSGGHYASARGVRLVPAAPTHVPSDPYLPDT